MKSYEDGEALGLVALGRAVLQVINELPDYPSDPKWQEFRCGRSTFPAG
jgi:hypothetical protein